MINDDVPLDANKIENVVNRGNDRKIRSLLLHWDAPVVDESSVERHGV
jgi:hypothetical protein